MGYSKKQFIDGAFEEIGYARYNFHTSPEQEESVLRVLDSMMAEWNAKGIRINYPLSDPDNSNIDSPSGVPDAAYEAIRTNLAVRIAPMFGRQVMPATTKAAATSFQTLSTRFAVIPQMQYRSGTPLGAGNKPWLWNRGPFIQSPIPTVDVGPDGILELN